MKMVWKLRGMRLKKKLKYDKDDDVRDGQATSRDMLWQKKQKNQLYLRIKTKRMKRKRAFNNINRNDSRGKKSRKRI